MTDLAVAFHFSVLVGGMAGDSDTRFQEVSGLSAEVGVEEYREGGLNDSVHRLPTGAKHGNLVLKRGFTMSSALAAWCRRAIEDFEFDPQEVLVFLGEQHQPLATWGFVDAYPVKWSVSSFNAEQNALTIESLELAYRRVWRV